MPRPRIEGPLTKQGYLYKRGGYKPKRNYSVTPAVKSYVNKAVKKDRYSKQQVTTIDFDNIGLGGQLIFNLMIKPVGEMIENDLFDNGITEVDTDDVNQQTLDIKLDYVKWQLRYSLGESETASAVSQTVREIFFRTAKTFDEVANPANIPSVADDLDGNVKYHTLYGRMTGLINDKMMYLHSQSADSDTTAAGQVISKGYRKLKIVDTLTFKEGGDYTNVDGERGVLCLEMLADDPSGTNGAAFGYVEIGWRYKVTS